MQNQFVCSNKQLDGMSLNTSSCLSSSPSSSSSTGYSTSSTTAYDNNKEINPMIQKLLLQPTSSSTVRTTTSTQQQQTMISTSKTLDEIESEFIISEPKANVAHDLLSLELKRKLNIKSNKSKSIE